MRAAALATVAAVLAAGAAHASPARVSGGGSYRDRHGKDLVRRTLTIEGRPTTGSGRADYTVHGPGKARRVVRITLSCVAVDGSTAYASGRDGAGAEWFVKVLDSAGPGRTDHWGVSRAADTVAGVPVPAQVSTTCRASGVATRAIHAGNLQVVADSSGPLGS